MKSTLALSLAVLFIVGLLKMDVSSSPQSQLNAQPPTDAKAAAREGRLAEDIERYMEKYSDREHHPRKETLRERRADKEHEEIARRLQQRDHDSDHPDRERMHAAHREQQHQVEQQKHRIEKMHLAAHHLEEVGLHDMAHQIHRQAEEQETHLREHLERTMHRDHRQPPPHEIHELLHQLRNEIRELKGEVRELRTIVSERSSNTEQ